MSKLTQTDKTYLTAAENGTEIYDIHPAAEENAVGTISVLHYDCWDSNGISFFTEPEFRRKGYAADAVHSFTRWYYDNNTDDRLIAVVPLENVPAIRTLERAGYEYVRSMRLALDGDEEPTLYHLYICTRETADAGAPPKGCCCGCGGHAE